MYVWACADGSHIRCCLWFIAVASFILSLLAFHPYVKQRERSSGATACRNPWEWDACANHLPAISNQWESCSWWMSAIGEGCLMQGTLTQRERGWNLWKRCDWVDKTPTYSLAIYRPPFRSRYSIESSFAKLTTSQPDWVVIIIPAKSLTWIPLWKGDNVTVNGCSIPLLSHAWLTRLKLGKAEQNAQNALPRWEGFIVSKTIWPSWPSVCVANRLFQALVPFLTFYDTRGWFKLNDWLMISPPSSSSLSFLFVQALAWLSLYRVCTKISKCSKASAWLRATQGHSLFLSLSL